jgi:hypothetical protein
MGGLPIGSISDRDWPAPAVLLVKREFGIVRLCDYFERTHARSDAALTLCGRVSMQALNR